MVNINVKNYNYDYDGMTVADKHFKFKFFMNKLS
jgi:hypothetical protein